MKETEKRFSKTTPFTFYSRRHFNTLPTRTFSDAVQPTPVIEENTLPPPLGVKKISPNKETTPEINETFLQWTILKECKNTPNMEARDDAHLAGIKKFLDQKIDPKFRVISSSTDRYSDNHSHGYTYKATLGASAIGIHTYPEKNSVTVNIELCSSQDKIDTLVMELKAFYGAGIVDVRVRDRVRL